MARVKISGKTAGCPAKDEKTAGCPAKDEKRCGKPGAGLAKDLGEAAFTYTMVNGAQLLDLAPQEWALSRALDERRVSQLAQTQAERIVHEECPPDLFLPTPITVARLQGPLPRCILMDGRLRLEVLRRLAGGGIDPASVRVALCEVRCDSQEEVEALHRRLNAGAALPPAYYKKKLASWLDDFVLALVKAFPGSASPADRPQRPRFNPGLVKKQLATLEPLCEAVAEGTLTVDDMMATLVAENEIEKKLTAIAEKRMATAAVKGLTPTLVAKARKNGFALGLRNDWPLSVAVRALALAQ